MTQVTKTAFFAALRAAEKRGHDIMPVIVSEYDQVTGYTSEWRNVRSRTLFGKSDGGTHLQKSRYWLTAAHVPEGAR